MRGSAALTLLLFAASLAGCITDETNIDAPEVPPATDDLAAEGLSFVLPISSFEPTIAVSKSGAVFMSVFEGFGPSQETVFRSTDKGLTWESVTPTYPGGIANYPGNSNDPFVYLDRDTDRLFNFEMQGLSCNTMAYSDDDGDTWTTVPLGCTPTQVLQDHQSIFTSKPRTLTPVGYDNIVHYCINRVADTACAFSLDGGITWGPMRALVFVGVAPTDCIVAGGLAAHGTSGPDGTIYLPRGYCGTPTVAISEDDGITWTLHDISETPMRGHEVRLALDDAGNAYAAWIGEDLRAYFAQSADGGRTWEPALDITPAGVTLTDFPAIAAGAEGRVAVSFIGANATNAQGEALAYDEVPWDTEWSAWIVTATGLTTPDATWRSVTVNATDDPIARGQCGGSRCNGIGDFLDIDIDEEGRPWAAFVDVCHDACREETDPGQATNVNDVAYGLVGTLNTGPALRGDLVALAPLHEDVVVEAVAAPQG